MPTQPQTQARQILDYAILQSVSESYLHQWSSLGGTNANFDAIVSAGSNNIGSNGQGGYFNNPGSPGSWPNATGLTAQQAIHFNANYRIVAHYPNDSSGFSATLFERIVNGEGTGEYTFSIRSTEFASEAQGGDWERDGTDGGADENIKNHGYAVAQLASMEMLYSQLREGLSWGRDPTTGDMGWVATEEVQGFAAALNSFRASVTVTGYSLGGHLATAFALMHHNDSTPVQAVTFNPAGVGGIDGHAPNGQQIKDMIALYNLLENWDGTEASLGAGPTPFIDLHAIFRSLELHTDEVPYLPQEEALRSLITAAQTTAENVDSPYNTDRYEAFLELLDTRASGTQASGIAAVLEMAYNYASGGFHNDDFRTNAGEVPDWSNFIHQYFGHGAFFDPQIVSNSGWHAKPVFELGIPIEDLPMSRGYGVAELLTTRYRDMVGDFGETHSITLLSDSLTVLDLIQRIDGDVGIERFRRLLAAATHRVDTLTDVDPIESIVEPFGVLGSLGADQVHDADGLEQIVNMLSRIFLGGGVEPITATYTSGIFFGNRTHRDLLHNRIKDIIDSPDFVAMQDVELVSLRDLPATELAEMARTDVGIRFALIHGDALAITGAGAAAIFADESAGGALEFESYGESYFVDRAQFLAFRLRYDAGLEDDNDDLWRDFAGSGFAGIAGAAALISSNLADKPYAEEWDAADGEVQGDWDFIDYNAVGAAPTRFTINGDGGVLQDNHVIAFGNSENNELDGLSDSDHIYGGGGSDNIYGRAGNDLLAGGEGSDYLYGGAGNDLYRVDGADTIIELADEGYDTVISTGNFTLGEDVEALTLVGASAFVGRGTYGDNVITGNALNNVLSGGTGSDHLYGGLGNDRYEFSTDDFNGDHPSSVDTIFDIDGLGSITFNSGSIVTGTMNSVLTSADGSGVWRCGAFDFVLGAGTGARNLTILHRQTGSRIVVESWQEGQLGIQLSGSAPEPEPAPPTSGTMLDQDRDNTQLSTAFANNNYTASGSSNALDGGLGDDRLTGGGGRDLLLTGSGDNRVDAGAGDDVVISSVAAAQFDRDMTQPQRDAWALQQQGDASVLFHGEGWRVAALNDGETTIAQGMDTIGWDQFTDLANGNVVTFFAPSSDPLYANGRDIIDAGSGNDYVFSSEGDDHVQGGADNDTIIAGADNDIVLGGDGVDHLFGDYRNTGGFDEQDLSGATLSANAVVHGDDILDGGAGNDFLYGAGGHDTLNGGDGNDYIEGDNLHEYTRLERLGAEGAGGLDGRDVIDGGAGNDLIHGGGGDDNIAGGTGDDQIDGDYDSGDRVHDGADTIRGGDGNDLILGGGGNDVLLAGDAGNDTIYGDSSGIAVAFHGNDTLDGGAGNDVLYGQGGNDTLAGGAGEDTLEGGAGDDMADGGSENDLLFGHAGNDTLAGGDGGDHVEGGEGNDTLDGGAGTDEMVGDVGNDTMTGGDGNDVMDGGAGADTISGGNDNDLLIGGSDGDSLSGDAGNDELQGDGGDDTLNGGSGDDKLYGDAGNDTLILGTGNDFGFGGEGNDTIAGGAGNDRMAGDAGDDFISGGDGNDLIVGGEGNDTLTGGNGDDLLSGGAGSDTYVLSGDSGRDQIVAGAGGYAGDVIRLDDVSDLSLLTLQRSGTDLLISNDANGSMVQIAGYFVDPGIRIEGQAGIVLTHAQVESALSPLSVPELHYQMPADLGTWTGTEGDDFFTDGHHSDQLNNHSPRFRSGMHIVAGGGADVVVDGSGDDFVEFGSGQDSYWGGVGGDDRVDFGDGRVTASDGYGDDVYLVQASAGGAISLGSGSNSVVLDFAYNSAILFHVLHQASGLTIQNGSSGAYFDIYGFFATDNRLVFSDGTVLTSDDLRRARYGMNPVQGVSIDPEIEHLHNDTSFSYYSGSVINVIMGSNSGSGVAVPLSAMGDDADNDVLLQGDSGNAYTYYAGGGNDTIVVNGGAFEIFGDNPETPIFLQGDDQITGANSNDYIYGMGGNDVIDGGDGNDRLFGGHGGDTLRGGVGNDRSIGGDGADTLIDTSGSNLLDGGRGDDALISGEGDDALHGGAGDDSLVSGGGNDYLSGDAGDDTLDGGEGDDQLHGNSGDDRVFGRSGNNSLYGESGDDYLEAQDGNDSLYGGNGDDELLAGDGNNVVDGGFGNDRIVTGAGNDNVRLGAGDDIVDSGAGDDFIEYGEGNAVIFAGDGNDSVSNNYWLLESISSISGGRGDDVIYLSYGSDVVSFELGDGRDEVFEWDNDTDGIQVDEVRFGAGITAESLVFTREGNDLIVTYSLTDSVKFGDWFAWWEGTFGDSWSWKDHSWMDRFTFSSGAEMSLDQIHAAMVANGVSTDVVHFTTTQASPDSVQTYAIQAGSHHDRLTSGAGNDTISAGAGDDIIDAMAGNDLMDGGSGADTYLLRAGSGSDRIVDVSLVANETDAIVFEGVASTDVTATERNGDDLVIRYAAADVVTIVGFFADAASRIEEFRFSDSVVWTAQGILAQFQTGPTSGDDVIVGHPTDPNTISALGGNDTITGGGASDELSGDAGNDTLNGLEGNDVLNGGEGTDVLVGGADNDLLDGGEGTDTMTGGAGDDIYVVDDAADVVTELAGEGIDTVSSSISLTLAAELEYLELTGAAAINATGNASNNTLTGNGADNVLDGAAGDDTLIGGGGNDALIGGLGNDTMRGGAGDDVYTVTEAGDVIVEAAGEGVDTVRSTISLTLAAELEHLELTGTAVINATGNAANNTLTGNGADNVLDGAEGDDTLFGGEGNDALIGGLGNDTMRGGTGDDTYTVTEAGDLIVEISNEGIDTVRSSISLMLAAELEHVELTGTAAINATGNAASNTLTGNAGDNVLDGAAGDDTLNGGDGNDTLIGGAGIDTMRGGAGDDTYTVAEAGDVIVEASGEGIDTVMTAMTHTLADNFERLVLGGTTAINGTGNASDNVLTGNGAINTLIGGAGNDVLDGGLGNDKLTGGTGNDTYVVNATGDVITELANEGTDRVQTAITLTLAANVEELELTGTSNVRGTGNALDNLILGNSGANTLDGGLGNDTLRGGAGNDSYVVDSALDVVTELEAEGTDTVTASVDFVLGDHLENLTLAGTAAINGSGNALANRLTGNVADNVLDGGDGNDTLIGGEGNDQLLGGLGNDNLNGGLGADTLTGGDGNDTYTVDDANDVVTEIDAQGTDLINASVSYTIGNGVENLTLTGTTAINGTGNALANRLTGNTADNVLDGGDGNDALIGGEGNDQLLGGLGNDNLNGGIGSDALIGGDGNDVYTVDDANDVVTEVDAQGTDQVNASISYTLGNAIENLTLTGTTAINGTGNTLDNRLTGNTGDNLLDGGDGNDTLIGGDGADQLLGGVGNDAINGGLGIDAMSGGVGNDTYTVDQMTDVITELDNEGTDAVSASVSYVLGNHIENLTLTGTTAIDATGNTLDNRLTGNAAANLLRGEAGNDVLSGAAGNDVFEGGAGNDTITGGTGSDTYRYSRGGGRDVINTTDADATSVDVLELGADIALNQLTVRRSGNHLLITITGTTDEIQISNWYTNVNNRLDELRLAGGDVLTTTQIEALIGVPAQSISIGTDDLSKPGVEIKVNAKPLLVTPDTPIVADDKFVDTPITTPAKPGLLDLSELTQWSFEASNGHQEWRDPEIVRVQQIAGFGMDQHPNAAFRSRAETVYVTNQLDAMIAAMAAFAPTSGEVLGNSHLKDPAELQPVIASSPF